MKKKVIAIMGAALLLLSACGGQSGQNDASASDSGGQGTVEKSQQGAAGESQRGGQDTKGRSEGETAGETAGKSDKRVVLLVKQMANDFWVELVGAAELKAVECGMNLEVLCPLTADSNEEQIQLLEQALLDPPDVFIVVPADQEGITPAIEKINDAGIPIINLDTPITAEGLDILTYIGSNNYDLGYDLAKATAEKTGITGGKVLIVEGKTGAASSQERTAGAEAAYAELGWEILDKQPGNWSRDESYNVVQNLLQKYNDVDVIQFNSVSMALGAYEAVLKSGQTDIKCVAVDKNAEALQIMEETEAANLFCLIDNPPDFIGSKGVELAAAYLDGEKVEAEYTTSGDIIAPDEPGWAELLIKYGVAAQ